MIFKGILYKQIRYGIKLYIHSKASALRRIRRFIPIDVMIRLYKAFILPHLEYCGPLFVGIGKIQSNRIDSANYYISKTLLGHAKTVPYEQLLKTVGMLNLDPVHTVLFCSVFKTIRVHTNRFRIVFARLHYNAHPY